MAPARARISIRSSQATILLQHGIDPVLQLTCRDRNRIALQSELVGAAAMGIRNVMMLTGDDPKAGDQPEAKPVFDLDSSGLMRTAASIRDKGELPHGRKVGGKAEFLIGCSDVPLEPRPGWAPEALKRKIARARSSRRRSSAWTWICCVVTSLACARTGSPSVATSTC
jgi:methylenetetrahydrofolate reductase (NADPH)